jgi:hypothetical protein
MSDLYLELRSRIPVVADRTAVGRDRLDAAQRAVGLSNERLARLIPISEKTWRRWKDRGEVPTYALPKVAQALRLELVSASPPLDELGPFDDGDPRRLLEEIGMAAHDGLEGQAEILSRLAAIEAKLDALDARQLARPAPRRRGG